MLRRLCKRCQASGGSHSPVLYGRGRVACAPLGRTSRQGTFAILQSVKKHALALRRRSGGPLPRYLTDPGHCAIESNPPRQACTRCSGRFALWHSNECRGAAPPAPQKDFALWHGVDHTTSPLAFHHGERRPWALQENGGQPLAGRSGRGGQAAPDVVCDGHSKAAQRLTLRVHDVPGLVHRRRVGARRIVAVVPQVAPLPADFVAGRPQNQRRRSRRGLRCQRLGCRRGRCGSQPPAASELASRIPCTA